jgi:hypothetical protein
MLAEQAGDMVAGGCEAVIERRGDEHFDDRRARPAELAGVDPRLFHIGKAGGEDDSGGQMRASARAAGEVRQPIKGDIHAEGAGP